MFDGFGEAEIWTQDLNPQMRLGMGGNSTLSSTPSFSQALQFSLCKKYSLGWRKTA